MKNNIKVCHNCNLFQYTCKGERFETKEKAEDCIHRQCGADNTKNRIQVDAFRSLFKTKIAVGMDNMQAFAEAVVQTGDKAYAEAVEKRSHLIARLPKTLRGRTCG